MCASVCVCVCVCARARVRACARARVWERDRQTDRLGSLKNEAAYAQVKLLRHSTDVHVPGSLMAHSTQHRTTAHETSNKSNVNWRYKRYCKWMCVWLLQVSDQGGGIARSNTDLLFNYMFSTAPQPPKSDTHTAPLAGRYPVCLISLPLI